MSATAEKVKRGPGRPKKEDTESKAEQRDLTFEQFRMEYLMNSIGQRLPADAFMQAHEIYQTVTARDYEGRKDDAIPMVLKAVALNAGKPMAPHSLITEAEKIWKIIK